MTVAPVWIADALADALLPRHKLVERLLAALAALGRGEVVNPPQTRIDEAGRHANFVVFPVLWPQGGVYCVKVLAGVEENPARGLPFLRSTNLLVDITDGSLRAVVESTTLTALRTAAASAVALGLLGAPDRGATLSVIGTGRVARAHVEILRATVAGLSRVLIASARGSHARAAATAAALCAEAVTVADAVRRADVLVTATTSVHPVFDVSDVAPDAVVLTTGGFRPGRTEIPLALIDQAATLLSDLPSRLLAHWTDAQGTKPAWGARALSLTDLASGAIPPVPRTGLRLFLSEGLAVEDAVATLLVVEAAERTGAGQRLG